MTLIYEVRAKRHQGSSKKDMVLFYDEDRETAIKYLHKYALTEGFAVRERDGNRYTVADLILRERESTGKGISDTPYIRLFDENGNRRRDN